ncbi:tetratricopeptide repeat protein [Mariniluteicoccus flavus]
MTAPDPDWESRVADFWATADFDDREGAVARMRDLAAERGPHDADARFELGGAYDSAGFETDAQTEYAAARALGLTGARLAQLNIQQGSTLRNLGRLDEAIAMLEATEPDPSIGDARAVFLALALRDAGRPDEALRLCIEALVPHLPRYQHSVAAYARALTEPDTE